MFSSYFYIENFKYLNSYGGKGEGEKGHPEALNT